MGTFDFFVDVADIVLMPMIWLHMLIFAVFCMPPCFEVNIGIAGYATAFLISMSSLICKTLQLCEECEKP